MKLLTTMFTTSILSAIASTVYADTRGCLTLHSCFAGARVCCLNPSGESKYDCRYPYEYTGSGTTSASCVKIGGTIDYAYTSSNTKGYYIPSSCTPVPNGCWEGEPSAISGRTCYTSYDQAIKEKLSTLGSCGTTTTYIACKSGYYLGRFGCVQCPDSGKSADKNNTGITACYLPSGTKFTDTYGSGEYTGNCYHD